ncbi:methyl-accepting chemotaxis protein [Oharaeibacter diazotrophicus]|uniref:Methyl-accepting chemotaxis protein n=1 Tax=Oharaeibacter diazotrophicus TaxID=1920512 RepID=A0A4R6RKR9_9HYPH|nr:methyl-accepting chemotaxis protein [Oharaeibacter diazotrophicus]TDP87229.1 methyl-accepting chemotaxis protein [Oharaeibacter diazotrophicus]BBE70828.1 methyl-accepting chemotaxis protein McpS [Pleomorphomonas sp. SM30]GLS77577.1 chemotaxis protein [Oharaeibacter diazotrophicus]
MNFSVRAWLIAAIGAIVAVALGQSLYSLSRLETVNRSVTEAQTQWTPSIDLLQQISFDLVQLRVRHARHILANDAADMGRIDGQIADVLGKMDKDRAAFELIETDPAVRRAYDEAIGRMPAYMALHRRLLASSTAGDKAAATALLNGEQKVASDAVLEPVRAALEAVRSAAAAEFATAEADYHAIRTVAASGAAALLLLGIVVMVFAVRGISRPVTAVSTAMGRIAGGDLATVVPHAGLRNEIGDLARGLEHFRDALAEAARLRAAAEEQERRIAASRDVQFDMLKLGAEMIGSINGIAVDMSNVEQNSQLVSTNSGTIASAAAEMVASVEQIFRSSEAAAEEARTVNHTAEVGRAAVGKVGVAMTNIVEAVDETAASVDNLARASEQIGQIMSVIETIAAQTNLLALNATIEAARAGEAGRGFAVVASEVKSLAGQTAKATDDITRRIETLREGMASISATMERSKAAVEAGRVAIGEAGATMETVSGQVGRVSDKMSEISVILRQQQEATQEISRSVENVAETAANNEKLLVAMGGKLADSNDVFTGRAREWHREGDPRSLCEVAKIDHVIFKKRVVDTVMGRDDWRHRDIPDHHACRLGKWYDAITDRRIRDLPAFAALVAPHERVHRLGHEVLEAHERREHARAVALLVDLNDASNEVIAMLDALSTAIGATQVEERSAAA